MNAGESLKTQEGRRIANYQHSAYEGRFITKILGDATYSGNNRKVYKTLAEAKQAIIDTLELENDLKP